MVKENYTHLYVHNFTIGDIKEIMKELIALRKIAHEAKYVMSEACILFDSVREGEYRPDSFTNQPMAVLINKIDAFFGSKDEQS